MIVLIRITQNEEKYRSAVVSVLEINETADEGICWVKVPDPETGEVRNMKVAMTFDQVTKAIFKGTHS